MHVSQFTSFTGLRIDNKDEGSQVAFNAHFSSSTAFRQIMVFDVVDVNYGGFYSPIFGAFVCPDDEVYFFSWAVTITQEDSQRAGEARLTIGGEVVKAGPRTGQVLTGDVSKTSSSQAIVCCEFPKGIALKAVVSDSDPIMFEDHHNNFMGFRLPNI